MAQFKYQHGDRPLEGYTIEHAVGRGGFGEVYFATSDAGREVALKALLQYEDIELRGISHCMNLKSPHLVSIFDVKENDDGEPFVLMEYVSGPSLWQLLQDSPSGLGEAKAAFFLREIGKGLTFLHDRGIVHRDLKPHNVFYEDGYVKIGDYSLSKAISDTHHSAHTITVGTVHYMAPEISKGVYDRSIDIYALGVMLYEMITGQTPYRGSSPGEIMMKHLTGKPDVSGIEEPFARVISKAMATDPADRYQTVQEMVEDAFGAEHVRDSVSSFRHEDLSAIAERVGRKVAVGQAGHMHGKKAPSSEKVRSEPDPKSKDEDKLEHLVERVDEKLNTASSWVEGKLTHVASRVGWGRSHDRQIRALAEDRVDDPLDRRQRRHLALVTLGAATVAATLFSPMAKGSVGDWFTAGMFVFTAIGGASAGLIWARRMLSSLVNESAFVQRVALGGIASLVLLVASLPALLLSFLFTEYRASQIRLDTFRQSAISTVPAAQTTQDSPSVQSSDSSGTWRVQRGPNGSVHIGNGTMVADRSPALSFPAPSTAASVVRNALGPTLLAICLPLFLMNWLTAMIPSRRKRLALGHAVVAAALGLAGAVLFDGTIALAMGVLVGISLTVQAASAFDPYWTQETTAQIVPQRSYRDVEPEVEEPELDEPDDFEEPAAPREEVVPVPAATRQEVVPDPVEPTPDHLYEDYGISRHSRLVALLLSLVPFLLLPLAGLQRFYVGKIGTGILWLFTWGLFGIGQLIDVILIAVGQFTDGNGLRLFVWTNPKELTRKQGASPALMSSREGSVSTESSALHSAVWRPSVVSRLLSFTGGWLLVGGLVTGCIVATGLPYAVAAGVFEPALMAADLESAFGYGMWPRLAVKVAGLVAGMLGFFSVAMLIVGRQGAGLAHAVRPVFSVIGMLGGLIVLKLGFDQLHWDALAMEIKAGRFGPFIDNFLETSDILPLLIAAALLFFASVLVLAFPPSRKVAVPPKPEEKEEEDED